MQQRTARPIRGFYQPVGLNSGRRPAASFARRCCCGPPGAERTSFFLFSCAASIVGTSSGSAKNLFQNACDPGGARFQNEASESCARCARFQKDAILSLAAGCCCGGGRWWSRFQKLLTATSRLPRASTPSSPLCVRDNNTQSYRHAHPRLLSSSVLIITLTLNLTLTF